MRYIGIVAVLVFGVAGAAQAGYFQGFEGGGYDFYMDSGCSAGVSTTVAHSGSQSAQFTLDATRFAYTRWKADISSYGYALSEIQASDWLMRTLGRSDLSPYLLFTVQTPDTTQETMAIQFSMAAIADNTWTQNTIDRAVTTFHVVGDRTGLAAGTFSASGTQGTLDDLSAITYSGGTKWGDFLVTHVRVGVGLWDAAQTYNGYADDVSITPEPATMALLAAGGIGMLLRRRRSK